MVCSFLILSFIYLLSFIYFLLSVLFVRAKQALTFAVCIGKPSAGAVGYILYYKTAKTSILFLSLPVVYNMGTEVYL